VIVRLLFWPLMRASARTSKRMAALQPQIKELQEKYKDNPQKLNQKMLELWREHKVNPASGCLPILIQFPILLGFYSMLQTAIELAGTTLPVGLRPFAIRHHRHALRFSRSTRCP
jgi:YidC/Oxa1 family membrane protein insertase